MDGISPALIVTILGYAKDGGLLVATGVALLAWYVEVKRASAKDKADAEFKEAILGVLGEVKTAISNGNIMLDMMTRGTRK